MNHPTTAYRRAALRERLARVIAADREAIARTRLPEHVVRCRALLAMRDAACRAIDAERARRAAARLHVAMSQTVRRT